MFRFALAVAAVLTLAACQSAEERAEEHYQSALALLAEGDLARATVEFRNVFELDGLHVEARRTFAQALRDGGDLQQSYSQFLRLAEQRPNDVEVRIALAEMAMTAQNWDQVRIHGRRALELVPAEMRDDPRLDVIDVTIAYADAVEADNAPARRATADTAAVLLETQPGSLPLSRILVDNAIRENDAPAALALLDAALVIEPDNRELHNTRLGLLAGLEDGPGVEAQLLDMIARFPEDDALVATLLRFLVAQGDTEGAQAFLRDRIAMEERPEQGTTLRATLVQFLLQVDGPEAALAEVETMIAAYSDEPRYRMMRAAIRFSNGDQAEAIAEMEALVEGAAATGQLNDARVALAQMYGETGNPVGARRLVAEVLEVDGSNVAALKLEANALIDEDRADEAIALLRRALDEAPNDATAMTLMARAHTRNGNHELARDFLALAFEAANAAPPEALRYADNLVGDELYLAAEETLITALRLQPGNLQLLNGLGRIYVAMQDWDRDQQVENTVRRQETEQSTALANGLRAERLAASGEMGDAIAFLQELAEGGEQGEGSLAAQVAVLRAMLADGQIEEARAYSTELVQNAPSNLALLMMRAATESADGDADASIATYREVIALEPAFERAWIELIRRQFAAGDPTGARETLNQALETLPGAMNLLWAQASFLEQAGDIDGAVTIYERLYEEMPDSPVIANNLASLISTYRTDEASLERAYTIARRLRGTAVPPLMDTYGWIAFRRGDIDEARPYLVSAAAALPEDPLVQFHYGMLLAATGEDAAAIEQLTRALEIAGEDDPRAQFDTARAELERLQAATEQ